MGLSQIPTLFSHARLTLFFYNQVVSLELIRVAVLWHEAWHEALEEASQLYFGEQNVDGMLRVLAPLHHIVERLGAETLHEISFTQARVWAFPNYRRLVCRLFRVIAQATRPYKTLTPFRGHNPNRRTVASSPRLTSGAGSTAKRARRRSLTRRGTFTTTCLNASTNNCRRSRRLS